MTAFFPDEPRHGLRILPNPELQKATTNLPKDSLEASEVSSDYEVTQIALQPYQSSH